MGLILTLILGGFAGWIASLILNRNGSMGIFLNIVVGIVGAFLANLLLGVETLGAFTLAGFVWSVVGAVVLLAIVNLVTRRSIS